MTKINSYLYLKENIEIAFKNFQTAIQKHVDINKKRADGGWSVGEIADHIIKSTQSDFGATKKTERTYDKNVASIRETFLNFKLKFPAAPFLQPNSRQYSVQELFISLDNNMNSIVKMINEENLTETCSNIELPVWGCLTKYEWLVLIENHLVRHTKQINDFYAIVL